MFFSRSAAPGEEERHPRIGGDLFFAFFAGASLPSLGLLPLQLQHLGPSKPSPLSSPTSSDPRKSSPVSCHRRRQTHQLKTPLPPRRIINTSPVSPPILPELAIRHSASVDTFSQPPPPTPVLELPQSHVPHRTTPNPPFSPPAMTPDKFYGFQGACLACGGDYWKLTLPLNPQRPPSSASMSLLRSSPSTPLLPPSESVRMDCRRLPSLLRWARRLPHPWASSS